MSHDKRSYTLRWFTRNELFAGSPNLVFASDGYSIHPGLLATVLDQRQSYRDYNDSEGDKLD